MPKQFALLIFIFIILYLFYMDRKNNEGVSHAIWIPFIWMALAGSRTVGQWLNLGPPQMITTDAYLEGSPIDRSVYMMLIFSGIFVLLKRRLNWSSIFKDNTWIWLYFAFGLLSCLWSDYTFVSFKRWFKALGNVIMVLVVLTEARPYVAFGVVLKRLAFLLLPLSVLFVKFYPELGRAYAKSGQPMFTGVGFQKNALGQICLVTGIYFAWNLLISCRAKNLSGQKLHFPIYLIIVSMLIWLFYMANSATSFACMVVAIGLFAFSQYPAIKRNPQKILVILIICAVLFAIMEFAIGIKDTIIALLGRKPDFTERVDIWKTYFSLVRNPIVGYGFESFYASARMQNLADDVFSAHNGYLEMYLNLGIIGVLFILAWIISGLKKFHSYLLINYPAAILRLALIVIVCLYSWTEATFAGVNNIFLFILFAVISVPKKEKTGQNKVMAATGAILKNR
jgi:O-antigen ligase